MKIYYIRKWTKIYKNPRKENRDYYSKIAIFIPEKNRVEYGYIHSYSALFSLGYRNKYYGEHKQNYYPCTIIKNALICQNIIKVQGE